MPFPLKISKSGVFWTKLQREVPLFLKIRVFDFACAYIRCALSVPQQLSPDINPDFVFHEGPPGPGGQKGQKGEIGLPGDPVYLPARSDVSVKGTFDSDSLVV